jgi:DNA-binding NarL/FixJ family response regulator
VAFLGVSILLVDDYEPWRRFVLSRLHCEPLLQVVCEVEDGLEAVKKAKELQPNLILLDIGLPTLDGLQVARQIRKLIPESKIIFVSQESCSDVVQEALALGEGYVAKFDAVRELLIAVDAVLQGRKFVSARLAPHDFKDTGHTIRPIGPNDHVN